MTKRNVRKRNRLKRRLRQRKGMAIVSSAVGLSAIPAVPYGQPRDLRNPGTPGPEQMVALILIPPQDAAPIAVDETEYDSRLVESGEARFYGGGFAGNPTANGETFNPAAL